jgi:hypothetical protein
MGGGTQISETVRHVSPLSKVDHPANVTWQLTFKFFLP